MLWGISEMVNARAFKPLPLCSAPLKILLAVICGALGMKESHLSNQKYVLRKCCEVFQKWWMLDLANLCHCVQYPWKLTSRDFFWSSRNTRKPLSKQKCVLRKCCRVSQKWWRLELANPCHCVQYPWKRTNRDFLWSSRNEWKPLCQQKCILRKCCEVFQKWWMIELANLCHCVQHPWKYY